TETYITTHLASTSSTTCRAAEYSINLVLSRNLGWVRARQLQRLSDFDALYIPGSSPRPSRAPRPSYPRFGDSLEIGLANLTCVVRHCIGLDESIDRQSIDSTSW